MLGNRPYPPTRAETAVSCGSPVHVPQSGRTRGGHRHRCDPERELRRWWGSAQRSLEGSSRAKPGESSDRRLVENTEAEDKTWLAGGSQQSLAKRKKDEHRPFARPSSESLSRGELCLPRAYLLGLHTGGTNSPSAAGILPAQGVHWHGERSVGDPGLRSSSRVPAVEEGGRTGTPRQLSRWAAGRSPPAGRGAEPLAHLAFLHPNPARAIKVTGDPPASQDRGRSQGNTCTSAVLTLPCSAICGHPEGSPPSHSQRWPFGPQCSSRPDSALLLLPEEEGPPREDYDLE